jgi:hypothetical protein
MATDAASSPPSSPAATRKELLGVIAKFGDRPFQHEIVQSPWEPVVDVEGLHRPVKDTILRVLKTCGEPDTTRCLTVTGPSGYGKTHLLGWAREQLDLHDTGVFVYIPPYLADSGVVENFILQAVIDSLRHSSPRQCALFGGKVREFLVEVYDRKVRHRKNWRHLGLRYGLLRWLWPSWQLIGDRSVEDQLLMLQQALSQRGFLEMAFAKFKERYPFHPPGSKPDFDGFVAACLLACGDALQSDIAERWLGNKELRDPRLFDQPCHGQEKIRNILFTLNRLIAKPFFLAFDQMDDMYAVFSSRGTKVEDFKQLGRFLASLSYVSGICQVFMFQTSVWSSFITSVDKHLLDRMTATYGTQDLPHLDNDTAKALVRRRMQQFVWKELSDQGPPANEPYFPFKEEEIPPLRQQSQGKLRDFLQEVCAGGLLREVGHPAALHANRD